MRLTFIAIGCACALLSGCATLIDISKVDDLSNPSFDETFKPSFARLDNARDLIQKALIKQRMLSDLSGAGILVGGAGAGISGLFHGSRDLVAGLASVAGFSAAFNGLYGTKTYELIYIAGEQTLTCVRTKAQSLAPAFGDVDTDTTALSATLGAAHDKRAHLVALKSELRQALTRQKAKPAGVDDMMKRVGAALMKFDKAVEAAMAQRAIATKILQNEARYASAMDQAVSSVVFEVNNQIESIRPDTSAIAAAAGNVSAATQSTLGAALPPHSTPSGSPTSASDSNPPTRGTAPSVSAGPRSLDEIMDDIKEAMSDITGDANDLSNETDIIGSLTSRIPAADDMLFASCAMVDKTQAPALTFDPSGDLTVTQGTPRAVVVGGGTGAFRRADWTDAEPPPIKLEVVNGTILRLTPDKTSKDWNDGNTYTLVVTDLGAGHPPPARIKVTTKAKAASSANLRKTSKAVKPKEPPH